MTQSKSEFDVWDWLLFGAMLVISAGIGIFYACIGGRQKTTTEFLMGGRSMQLIPVAISILVSFMSAILILGTPAEMYTQGTQYFMYLFGLILAVILASQLFVPLLYPLQLTSSFEYLELRFNSKAAKLTGTIMMILQQVIYMGVASYAPSTALEAVTGFPTWATIITVGVVSTFYTFLGGMKAVVWTDVFQSIVMVAGLLAIVIQGTISVGGIDTVWRINDEWKRIEFFDFNPDPTQRHSFWSLIVGGMVGWTATYGVNQASVQRYCALPSLRKAKTAVLLNIIGVILLLCVTCVAGIVVFAYYVQKGCDPYTNDDVSNSNQIIPFFVMETLGYPGIPGLFVACLFSGALSTMSSCLNALSAVTWKDILEPFLGEKTETQKTWITRILVALYGGAGIGMAFMAKNLGGTVLQASLSFTGAASGPLLGIFALGAFFPWANWIGAVVGSVFGLALPFWISIGAYSVVGAPNSLPFPTENCTMADNSTLFVNMTTTTTPVPPIEGLDVLYTISYLWYPSIGMATVVVVGLLVSLVTGLTPKDEVDSKYLIPLFDRIFCCLPGQFRRCLRCYIEFEDPEDIKPEQDVEFSVDVDKPVIVPIKSDKFRENKYLSEPIGGISFKSLYTPENGHSNSGFESNEAPPCYSDIQSDETQIAKSEL
ncbi:sodium-coupled monocarboxylate transporter 1-like [Ostrea edulis]|uniref:sodium-coupled monocarboxylate transporter 1-like n=1 Tax=Ostrea edulis TaxID=37623 RepID=UPI0024AEB82C|nr:sodium-coupled monocarboxylate transporter 1-like [Ostrea edulis]XP_056002760.1 sodium-coupled monocarboxylate transporter 1-like [Ostrea edulis]XP_056002761.1 sodium-coupled monocarboxylate transporter 1-like [Ostrea edulis]XP_056002762.1 sodium-coupled monocarboxylate transporter 1-like [Ostrea edulis]